MLGNAEVAATLAVMDIDRAKRFYEGRLGLTLSRGPQPGVLIFKVGRSSLVVYSSEFAGTNKATAATWMVENVEATVKMLKAKGISFEHYDFPGVTLHGDVHEMGESKAAWFKDPDGNILAIVSE
ncbi:MAG TPA: VOC family protein [Gemmatimonadaceae bacterium]|jgi:predicted enzyme related to lactoylglutathione lyase|nr:VOC family protein [Gemmatimonadaceae bacterium]